jgi:hypothetical protein
MFLVRYSIFLLSPRKDLAVKMPYERASKTISFLSALLLLTAIAAAQAIPPALHPLLLPVPASAPTGGAMRPPTPMTPTTQPSPGPAFYYPAGAGTQPARAAETMPASRPGNMAASAPGAFLSPEARQAQRLYNDGLVTLGAGDLIGARARLSAALSSGNLPSELDTPCRTHLMEITQKVVFSPEVYPGDQDSYYYVLKSGDMLVKVVKREQLFVNEQAIQRINNIPDVRKLRAGQRIKLVKGPFDAIVTKHSYTLDLYHSGMFVKSYRIGLGLAGKTPVGKFKVKSGGRVPQAPWTSPQGGKVVYFGQPGYPLGRSGFWIGLEAADEATPNLPGFGVHGTNEPDSIGRDASSGCIRLLDDDIEELFGLLYDGLSKVEVRP